MRGWTSRAVPALLLLVAVTACGDSRLKKLSVGIEKDSVAERKMSPVVFAEGKVTGWGWDYWEKQAKTLNIPVPAKE